MTTSLAEGAADGDTSGSGSGCGDDTIIPVCWEMVSWQRAWHHLGYKEIHCLVSCFPL